MRFILPAIVLGGAVSAVTTTRPAISTIEPSLTQIVATEATMAALSPVSNVKGAGFDRIVQIWLENTVRKIFSMLRGNSANSVIGLRQSCC
jgi:acid phosphatase